MVVTPLALLKIPLYNEFMEKDLKVLTREEANQILPEIRSILSKLQDLKNAILAKEAEIDALELITSANKQPSAVIAGQIQVYNQTVADFYQNLDLLSQKGCHLKNLDLGLVDFYSLYQGKLVYLCWKTDEPQIKHWHEIGRGFDSRQPYTP